MISVGLTGGIGSGKTTVSKLIRILGYPVYEADVEAKKIISEDLSVKAKIINLLGEEAYDGTKYNRLFVAQKVFNDKALLQGLNDIVHPAVAKHFKNWKESHSNSEYVFQEAAILFENGSYLKFDKTILITSPEAIRVKRVMKRDNLSHKEVMARINNQWSDDKKMELADFSIQCDGYHLVIPQLLKVLKQL